MGSPEIIVGIYDEDGGVARAILNLNFAGSAITAPVARERTGSGEQVLIDKQLLLESSTCVVVVVTSLPAISVLSGALRRLVSGQLDGVFAISEAGIEPLLNATRIPTEAATIERTKEEGRLVSVSAFDEQIFIKWCSHLHLPDST